MAKKKTEEEERLAGVMAEAIKPTDEQLKRVAKLVKAQVDYEDKMANLEDLLTETKKNLDAIRTVTLPEVMKELGLSRVDLTTGEKLMIKTVIGASIKIENRFKAYQWLRNHGFGSLIKNRVIASFGMGQEKKATQILSFLLKKKCEVIAEESVHTGTLSAFVREQLEDGKKIPQSLLGVFQYEESKITRPKK